MPFLVTCHNGDIIRKDKEGRLGWFQEEILPHPNSAVVPFMCFMTKKEQIVS